MTTTPNTAVADHPLRRALSARPRPSRPSRLAASLAFAWRALLKLRHVPEQLADVIGLPVVFTLMFTYLFGGALAGSTGAYLRFLLPGSLAMTVVLVTIYSGATLNTTSAGGPSTASGHCRSGRRPPSSAPYSATSRATCSPPPSPWPSAWQWGSGPTAASAACCRRSR
jgi:hypothetical protein